MSGRGRRVFRNRQTALYVGLGLTLAGFWVLRDAYEHRGIPRPAWLTFIPGA